MDDLKKLLIALAILFMCVPAHARTIWPGGLGKGWLDTHYAHSEDATAWNHGTISFFIDGAGSAITTGSKAWVRVPYAFTIKSWQMTLDQTGSIELGVMQDAYENYPPDNDDRICNEGAIRISAGTKTADATLPSTNGWNTTKFGANKYFLVSVDSVATATKALISFMVSKDA